MIHIEENDCMSWIFCTIPLDILGIMVLADNYRLAREGARDPAVGGRDWEERETRSGGAGD
jgi:hypothetical protein